MLGGALARLALAEAAHLAQPDRHVVERGEMREQIEALEHEADAAALDRKLALGSVLPAARDGDAADRPAVDVDRAGGRQFQMADAAQQRGLAGARMRR